MSQFERIAAIDRSLHQNGKVTVAEIAHRFEVHERTVKRDLEYLRNRLNAPIVWDKATLTYRYESSFDVLHFSDERALIVYALLKDLLLTTHYIPILSTEILEEAERRIPKAYRKVAEHIRYELPIFEEVDLEIFTVIIQAMIDSLRISLRYCNAKGETSDRKVECERLINYSGRWYLIAYDLLRNGMRTFHLSRIENAAFSHDKIINTPERSALVCAYIESGFGIFKGANVTDVTIRIHGQAAILVSRQIWHPDQRVETSVDLEGNPITDIHLPVANWTELLGRVLSFGSSAEALFPPPFREAWKKEVIKMMKRAESDYG